MANITDNQRGAMLASDIAELKSVILLAEKQVQRIGEDSTQSVKEKLTDLLDRMIFFTSEVATDIDDL